jgi:hypothetical protein
MTAISESAGAWRPTVELAGLPAERTAKPATPAQPAAPAAADNDGFKLFGEDGFTFFDFLDIINPLQHIPIIGTLYRQLTSDHIDPGSRVIGSTLFFGPLGTFASVGDEMVRDITGKDVGEHMIAYFDGQAPGQGRVAEAKTAVVADAGMPIVPVAATVAPAPAGGVDPVTTWAMNEMAYRKSMAERVQSSLPAPVSAVATAATAYQRTAAEPSVGGVNAAPQAAFIDSAHRRVGNPAARQASSAIRSARGGASLYAAASYGRLGVNADRGGDRDEPAARPAPSGAIAADGGWFTETMLSAHRKYQDATGRDLSAPARAVDLRN